MLFLEYLEKRIKGGEKNLPTFFYDKEKTYDYCIKNNINTVQKVALLNNISDFELLFDSVPDNFVVKPSFLSSMLGVMVLNKKDNSDLFYEELTKRTLSKDEVIAIQKSHFDKSTKAEKHIVIEKKVEDKYIHGIPLDYKVYIFYDQIALIAVFNRNGKQLVVDWYDSDFNFINDDRVVNQEPYVFNSETRIKISQEDKEKIIIFSKNVAKIIKLPFVSLDLYLTEEGPLLGEVTLCPGGLYYQKMFKNNEYMLSIMSKLWKEALIKIENI